MRRLALPLLAFALLPIIANCGGGSPGPSGPTPTPAPTPTPNPGLSRTVNLSVEWPARGRAAPTSALSVRITITGGSTSGTDVVFVGNRSSDPAAHTETYNSGQLVRFGTFPLQLQFFSGANATGTLVATANSTIINDASGVNSGTVSLTQTITSVEVAPNQGFLVGSDSAVAVIARDAANNIVAISEGSALLEITDGADKAQIVNGRLRGLANGPIRLRATVDGLTSGSVLATVGNASYTVAIAGTRGTIPVTINNVTQLAFPGNTIASTGTFSGTNPLTALASYGDRNFVAWRRGNTNISTSTTLASLPTDLGIGETLTAVYAPAGTRTGPLSPSYNQTDASYWPANRPIKVFFDPAISAEQKAVLIEGFDRWGAALGKTLYTVVGTAAESTVTINFGAVAGGVALTTVNHESNTIPRPIASATITFDPTKIPSVTAANERPVFVALAAHEFGHLLGIRSAADQGHSNDPFDTMYPVVTEDTKFITQRDMNSIQNIYFNAEGAFDGRKRLQPGRAVIVSSEQIPCTVQLRYK